MPDDKLPVDTTNKFLVGVLGLGGKDPMIYILRAIHPRVPIERADALNLAAYIVALLDPDGADFARMLEAVKQT